MDSKMIIETFEWLLQMKDKSAEDCSKYVGYASQVSETQRIENLNYLQMGYLAKIKKKEAEYWYKQVDDFYNEHKDIICKHDKSCI